MTKIYVPMDDSACSYYRIIQRYELDPSNNKKLCKVGHFEIENGAEVITLRICNETAFEALLQTKKNYNLKFTIDFDDDVWHALPEYNKAVVNYQQNYDGMKKYLNQLADKVTCSTETLKKALTEFVPEDKIEIVPNKIVWNFPNVEPPKENIFLYAGSPTHWSLNSYGDFSKPLVEYLSTQKLNVFGVKPHFLPNSNLVSEWASMKEYPEKFYNCCKECRFVIAPLVDNYFNHCKSNLKYLETAACHRVVLCSELWKDFAHPYQIIPWNTTATGIANLVKRANKHYNEILDFQRKQL